jgi:hypothetical protein
MVVRTGRLARRGDKDELVFYRLLLGGGRRLRENDLGGSNLGSLLLRVCGLLEGVVMRSDLVLVSIPRQVDVYSVEDLKQASMSKLDS